ncbi:MAG: hypothetical protein ACTSQV_06760 [Alphaproteobacteria bacterium]
MSMPNPAQSPADANGASDIRERIKGANINEVSLLATDYLNHFNEIVMLLDMIPDMAELLDEAKAWAPKGYKEHFQDSAFSEKELAIEAYDAAPPEYREMFEETVECLNKLVALSLMRIEGAVGSGEPDAIANAASNASRDLRKLMDVTSAIINGAKTTISQDEIDSLLLD